MLYMYKYIFIIYVEARRGSSISYLAPQCICVSSMAPSLSFQLCFENTCIHNIYSEKGCRPNDKGKKIKAPWL